MVGWEKPVTRYNKNKNNNKNNNKNLHCHKECSTYVRMLEIKNAGDQEWLNARGKKRLRSARWHLCSLSLTSLLLDSTVACTLHFQCYCITIFRPISVLAVQRSLPSVSDRHIYIFTYTSSDSTAYAARLFASR